MSTRVERAKKKIREAWNGAVWETDWSQGQQVSVLRDFIDQLVEEDTAIAGQFEDFLDVLIQEEEAEKVDGDKEVDA